MNKNIDKEKALHLMKSTTDKRMFERYQSIYLLLSNMKINEVASIVGRSPRTIKNYKKSYSISGLEGLTIGKPTGRPKRLTEKQLKQLRNLILTKLPADVNFPTEFNWTANTVCKWIKNEYGVKYTIPGVANILKRLGLSHTRIYTLPKINFKKQENFKSAFKN
ncbi:helix-turn-helix domain-containing protein [Clostridium oceanicum]|uniref:Winged helix-turn helix domain-containing protein n=1 Tax=Clostridium oceanicum TaxID=1543 RepID=A0ABP3UK54_9CLOT